MGVIEGFWIRNYKSLKQVGIGTGLPQFVYVEDESTVCPYPLGPVTLFAGASGSGKSTVIDAFSFVSDCFRHGVDIACAKRGGYEALYSQGAKGAMSFGFHYRQNNEAEAATYAISIGCAKNKAPYIESELLAYRRGKESLPVIFLQNGAKSIRYLAPDARLDRNDLMEIELTDYRHLGLAALREHPKYPVFASIRNLFENWVLSHFTPDPARGLDASLPRRHDSSRGVSLSGLVRYAIKSYGEGLPAFFARVSASLPEVEAIQVQRSQEGKPFLTFKLDRLSKPVPITLLSDATIRLFAYLILIEEDRPAPMIAIEEPENGLDRLHCWKLTQQIVRFNDLPRGSQLFLTTHHPGLADVLYPDQIWLLARDQEGFTTIERAADSLQLQEMLDKNEELGPRWFSERFEDML